MPKHDDLSPRVEATELMDELDTVRQEIESLQTRIAHLEAAMRAPVPTNSSLIERATRPFINFRRAVAVHGGYRAVARKAATVVSREGVGSLMQRLRPVVADSTFADALFSPGIYINSVVPRRRDVLGSAWHVGLIRSRTETPDPARLPPLTITAVTYNSVRWLPGFFASLRDQNYPLRLIELIIVDNGSSDATLKLLTEFAEEHGPQFRSLQILQRPNDGFGAGHNAALECTTTDLVMVTNVDLHFGPESILRAVLAAQADDPQVACWELAQVPHEHPKYYDPVTLETAWSAHACVLMRRKAVTAVGGYDDKIFMYGEDVELSYRLRAAGNLLRYLPWVRVTHFVQLDDPSSRPRQLGGSLAASVLLRYRYADPVSALAAERTLVDLAKKQTDPNRRQGFAEALRQIHAQKQHFMTARRPERRVPFPFQGFDYMLSRDGHDTVSVEFQPSDELPRVSVVTRTYGSELGYLSEAIASVLNQTYPAIEHVIVEDRGDHARALVEKTAETYGRELRHVRSPGAGRSDAGNAGMAAATGDLLMLLDNDDLLFADHVSTVAAAMINNPRLVAAYSLAWEVRMNQTDTSYTEDLHMLHPQFRVQYSRLRLRRSNFIPIQAILFRRSLFETAGGFDEGLEALEDWYLWNKYAQFGPFELVPRLTSLYHTPGDPTIRAKRQEVLDAAYEPVKALIQRKFG